MLSETGVNFSFFFSHLAALAQVRTELAWHKLYPSRFYNLHRDSFFGKVKFAQLLTIWKTMEQKDEKMKFCIGLPTQAHFLAALSSEELPLL